MPMSTQRTRRRFLTTLGAGAIAGIGGCAGGSNSGSGESTTTAKTESSGSPNTVTIIVHSGAGLKKPMIEIGKQFEKATDNSVKYNFAGSNTLLSQIELNKEGDVYMPGAKYYIDKATEKGFVDERALVAYHTPTIIVPEGNPAGVSGLGDLAGSDIDVAMGDSGACAIGRLGNKILKKNGILEQVEENIVTRAGTTNELVVYTTQKQCDAAITWRADVHGLEDETDRVTIDEDKNIIKTIPIGSLTFAEHPETANEFVDFVASNKGRGIFQNFGYVKYEGDSEDSGSN